MRRSEVDRLDPRRTYWVPAVVAPCRNWAGAPGCRRGGRFLVDEVTLRASRDSFPTFDSRLDCLQWVMTHRESLTRTLPEAQVRPVPLARWLLGLE